MNKYNNIKTTIDNVKFDSKAEANRYCELKLLQKAGNISKLSLQVAFELLPKQKDERKVVYKCDFLYEENGQTIAEDVKGMRTQAYILKRKMFKARYPDVIFREI